MGFRAYDSKRGGQKNAKCYLGFDSDTFTKKMIKTAEN